MTPIDVIVCHAQQIPPNLKGTAAETCSFFLLSCHNSLQKKKKRKPESRDVLAALLKEATGPGESVASHVQQEVLADCTGLPVTLP